MNKIHQMTVAYRASITYQAEADSIHSLRSKQFHYEWPRLLAITFVS